MRRKMSSEDGQKHIHAEKEINCMFHYNNDFKDFLNRKIRWKFPPEQNTATNIDHTIHALNLMSSLIYMAQHPT